MSGIWRDVVRRARNQPGQSARGKILGSCANCSSKAEDKQVQADAEEHGDGFGAHHSWAPQLPLPVLAGPMNIIGCLT